MTLEPPEDPFSMDLPEFGQPSSESPASLPPLPDNLPDASQLPSDRSTSAEKSANVNKSNSSSQSKSGKASQSAPRPSAGSSVPSKSGDSSSKSATTPSDRGKAPLANTTSSTTAVVSGDSGRNREKVNSPSAPDPSGGEGTPVDSRRSWSKVLWRSMPSWMISTVVHVGALLALAAWNIEPIKHELKLMLTAGEAIDEGEALQEMEMASMETSSLEATENNEIPSEVPQVDTSAMSEADFSDVVVPMGPDLSVPSTQSLAPASALAAQANSALKVAMTGRSKETKRELLKKFGGTSETEKAVSLALKWLAEHQDKQTGAWTLAHGLMCNGQCDHSSQRRSSFNAATGLALMCFLGAGQTHMEGEYKEVVFKGLSYLIRNVKYEKGMGSWWAGDGNRGLDDMYAHGICTIAMCEAFGMTRDPKLLEPAQAGVNYLVYAQNPSTGGWHYGPQGLGDTSVVGWQMMALKSAAMSGLVVDINVVRKANQFLDQMSWENGTSYHYDFRTAASKAGYNANCTACACLCRMYSGMRKDHPALVGMVEKFSKDGPSKNATYYNYYATQVMKQYGGKAWDDWNNKLRDQLVSQQTQSGHPAGSWYWRDAHGHSDEHGGRFYQTCMATMMLEVYYRYLPIYAEQAEEDAFEL